jgi:uncharacterized protein YkwD
MTKTVLSLLCLGSLSLAVAGCGQPLPAEAPEAPALDELSPEGLVADPGDAADFLAQATIDKTKAQQVVDAINVYRDKGGVRCPDGKTYPKVAKLTVNRFLTTAAERHSADMADNKYFSHTGRNGSTPATRAKAAGYTGGTFIGENIAAGNDTAAKTVAQWIASAGHCANLMSANYKSTGVGVAYNASAPYRWYWTQMFANP